MLHVQLLGHRAATQRVCYVLHRVCYTVCVREALHSLDLVPTEAGRQPADTQQPDRRSSPYTHTTTRQTLPPPTRQNPPPTHTHNPTALLKDYSRAAAYDWDWAGGYVMNAPTCVCPRPGKQPYGGLTGTVSMWPHGEHRHTNTYTHTRWGLLMTGFQLGRAG